MRGHRRMNRLEWGLREQLLKMGITLAELAGNDPPAPAVGRLCGSAGDGQESKPADRAAGD